MPSSSSTNSEKDQPKMTKSEKHLVSVFAPLKLSNDPKPLSEKYNRWLPKFKWDATWIAHGFIEGFY